MKKLVKHILKLCLKRKFPKYDDSDYKEQGIVSLLRLPSDAVLVEIRLTIKVFTCSAKPYQLNFLLHPRLQIKGVLMIIQR